MRARASLLALAAAGAAVAGASPARADAGAVTPRSSPGRLQPPPVMALPSRTGPEGPPRPLGLIPPSGHRPKRSAASTVRRQDRALLHGPFPSGALERGISDGVLFLSEVATTRQTSVGLARSAGARVIRIPVDWRDVVAPAPPTTFDPTDPASPSYDFGRIDGAVRAVSAAGMQPLLVVSHAPGFAEAPDRWRYAYPGSWAPDPRALEAFATALARRYSGSFASGGAALPRVRLLQAWNEPNLSRYLAPQWVASGGRWQAFSPLLYRQLLNAFYRGVKAVAPSDLVISAGVAPNGDPDGVGRMSPVEFLRTLMCLRRGERCPEAAHFDILAFHPLSVASPDAPAASSLDVSLADSAKVSDLLTTAERRGTIEPAGRKPIWVTELNWESNPPARHGVPGSEQAGWISRALHRLWIGGVTLVCWQFLVDPYPSVTLATPGGVTYVSRPAGLYEARGPDPRNAVAKPFLQGYLLPFDPIRASHLDVRIWALLASPHQPAFLQAGEPNGRWRTVRRLTAGANSVLNVLVALPGRLRLRIRVGSAYSAPELLSARPRPAKAGRPGAGQPAR